LTITKTINRLGTVFFLFVFNIGISIFVFLLTGIMIFSQVLFIIYAMFLPVSFILSMIPSFDGMSKRAITKLFNTILTRAGITLIITTAFSISTMLYTLSAGYPFFLIAFLQIVTFAGIYFKLGDLMSMFSLQSNDSQSVGSRVNVFDAETKEPAIETKSGNYVYQLKTTNGWQDTFYDAVFFSIGHPPYADYYQLMGQENYIHNPYPMYEVLGHLTGEEKIGVIGSGATGIDLMRFLMTNYDLKEPLTYFVPTGEIFNFPTILLEKEEFQFTFSKDWIKAQMEPYTGTIPLDKIIQAII